MDNEAKVVKVINSIINALQCPEKRTCRAYFQDRFERLFSLVTDNLSPKQVTPITKLLLITFDKMCETPIYEHYLAKLLDMLLIPCKQPKNAEFHMFLENIRDIYSVFGYILASTGCVNVIEKVLAVVVNHAKRMKFSLNNDGRTKLKMNFIVESKFPEILAELLFISEYNFYVKYLSALEKILITDIQCQAFIQYNTIDVIIKRLTHNWEDAVNYSDDQLRNLPLPQHLTLSSNILWLLVLAYSRSSQSFKERVGVVISRPAWRSARNIFVSIVSAKGQRKDRNKYYLLFRVLAGIVPYEYCTLLYHELSALAFISEYPQRDSKSWMSKVQFYPDNLDFEFKVSLLSTLYVKNQHPQTSKGLQQINAIPALLALIDPDVNVIWTLPQRMQLMLHGLLALKNIINITPEEFLAYNGPEKLLNVVKNSLNGIFPRDLIFPALCCIYTCLQRKDVYSKQCAQQLKQLGIVDLASLILKNCLSTLELSKQRQTSLGLFYCILEKLTNNIGIEVNELTKSSIDFLKKFIRSRPGECFLYPTLLIAVMDFVWVNAISTEEGLKYFTSCGGVYTVLDIIERFPIAIKLLGLSMLCDLCELKQCLAPLLTWRGTDGCTIVPLLIRIYREQSKFDQNHKIKCRAKETSALYKNAHNFNEEHSNRMGTSSVMLDFVGNCKPKIAAILHFLNCSIQSGLINECYRITPTHLSFEDKVTEILAEYYFSLKLGEAWLDVKHYLDSNNIKALEFDELVLAVRIKEYKSCLQHVQSHQKQHQMQQEKEDIGEECALYRDLKNQTLNEALDALNELQTIARSCHKRFKLREYTRMKDQLEQSVMSEGHNFHKTIPEGVHVNVFGSTIQTISDIVLANKEKPPRMITPSSSFTDHLFNAVPIRSATSVTTSWHSGFSYQDGIDSKPRKLWKSVDDI